MSHSEAYSIDIPRKVNFNLLYQLNEFQKTNEYDDKEAMKRFEQENRIDKYKKDLLKPIKLQNKRWIKNLAHVKVSKELQIEKRKAIIEDKMIKRDNKVNELLNLNKSLRSEQKLKRIKMTESSQQKIKENIDKYYEMVENERLITEDKVTHRLKERTQRQAQNIELIRLKFEQRNQNSEKRFEMSQNKLLSERKVKEKKDEEQKFENFMNWYFFFQEEKKKRQIKKLEKSSVRERCKFLQNELEEKLEKQRLETEQKMKKAEEKRRIKMMDKNKELHQKSEMQNKAIKDTLERKDHLLKENRHYNKEILRVQTSRILNGYEKDRSMDLNKSNIQ